MQNHYCMLYREDEVRVFVSLWSYRDCLRADRSYGIARDDADSEGTV